MISLNTKTQNLPVFELQECSLVMMEAPLIEWEVTDDLRVTLLGDIQKSHTEYDSDNASLVSVYLGDYRVTFHNTSDIFLIPDGQDFSGSVPTTTFRITGSFRIKRR